jgi:hypothetical protein
MPDASNRLPGELASAQPDPRAATRRRAVWLKRLHQWHWISSAVSLVGMLLFAITGITLNHAADIPADSTLTRVQQTLPQPMLASLAAISAEPPESQPLPDEVRDWLRSQQIAVDQQPVEWSADEAYLALPRAGGDAWLAIDLADGSIEYEATDRGWIAWLNDLHKGRNTGPVWRAFIDVFALATLVFCLTGLWLLHLHSKHRRLTWPLVGAGCALPMLIAVLWLH